MARTRMENGVEVALSEAEETARDAEEKKWADGKTVRDALKEIRSLEATVTQRRIRDMTTDAGKQWMVNIEKLISDERSKL